MGNSLWDQTPNIYIDIEPFYVGKLLRLKALVSCE
jgi:hypothetical protein